MNERIRELSEQARQYAESKMRLTGVKDSAAYDEKFAELIIKETLMVARVGMEFGPSTAEAVYTYFGVEE